MADVQDVCVLVSRWFGGVHLGPSRFAIINNTARQLLVQEGFMPRGATKSKVKK
jgi:putative IMPACT (imprinted ancient) family translation regulator